MSLEILCSMSYGSSDRVRYKLVAGNILPNDFFSSAEKDDYLKKEFIKESDQSPNTFPKGEKIKPLPDLGKMKISDAREFLEDEYDVAKLEKYHDQEIIRKNQERSSCSGLREKPMNFKDLNRRE